MLAKLYRAFIRWSFARFYREFSWTYDTVAWLVSRGLWRQWTLAALPYLSGRILETGCGTGYVQYALAQRSANTAHTAVGLDASPFMLAHTRRRLQRAGHEARLIHGVAQAIPCQDASFDTVLVTFPSEYIIHPDTLSEVWRVLLPGGRLVIVDAAQFTHNGWYERLVDLAYHITFQASVQREPAHIVYSSLVEGAGFVTRTYHEQVQDSLVTVLVATKRDRDTAPPPHGHGSHD